MKNKILIFGASGGLGRYVEETYFKTKYNVTGLSSSDVDIRSFKEVQQFFQNKDYDIVINCAGININAVAHKIDSKEKFNELEKMLEVNIIGNINIISQCLPYMRNQEYGRIITISSILASKPVIGTSIYGGTKGFIDSFIKGVALENAIKNVTINSIQLGYFDAGLTHDIPDTIKENIKNTIPMKRWGNLQELINIINMFIHTPYMTGQNIKINGGLDY